MKRPNFEWIHFFTAQALRKPLQQDGHYITRAKNELRRDDIA